MLPCPDIVDAEKDEEASFAVFEDANVCWTSPPPLAPVEKDIPLELCCKGNVLNHCFIPICNRGFLIKLI